MPKPMVPILSLRGTLRYTLRTDTLPAGSTATLTAHTVHGLKLTGTYAVEEVLVGSGFR